MNIFKRLFSVLDFFMITGKYILLSLASESNLTNIKYRWSKEIFGLLNLKLQVIGAPLNENM